MNHTKDFTTRKTAPRTFVDGAVAGGGGGGGWPTMIQQLGGMCSSIDNVNWYMMRSMYPSTVSSLPKKTSKNGDPRISVLPRRYESVVDFRIGHAPMTSLGGEVVFFSWLQVSLANQEASFNLFFAWSRRMDGEEGFEINIWKKPWTKTLKASNDESPPLLSKDTERTEEKSLAETYSLLIEDGSSNGYKKTEGTDAITTFFQDKEAFTASSDDNKKSDDVKLVLDFIEALHIAERRQAESDAYIFTEEKRKMKEKFEKELKDSRARELMYAEEAAILEKVSTSPMAAGGFLFFRCRRLGLSSSSFNNISSTTLNLPFIFSWTDAN
ncbi:hypothetical protein MA16_Dca003543 [Dendrobium catenatum]|uniref:Uncharacterized protein n=1 Tax=Dendrobium catenatum TaxID=906689 RepID=A0A2I0WFA4_9ASPA|nr:hypothetical protein MA16_Dca003543 [Dendrobium catenatum]